MATPRQLDFSSAGDDDDDDTSTPSPSFSRRKSPRKQTSETVAEEATEKQKTMKKLASPPSNRIWNEEDELIVLKGLVDYRAITGFQANSDWDAFYRFVGDSIVAKFSKEQLMGKVSKLKGKFYVRMEKINQGKDPIFTKLSDAKAFEYSNMVWGQSDSEFANHQSKICEEEKLKEDEQVATVEPLDEIGTASKTDSPVHGTSPSSQRKSKQKKALKRPASEAVAEEVTKNKKTKKLASPVSNRIWNKEDELAVLKGLVDYRAKTGLEPNSDWVAFYRFVEGSTVEKFSKYQLLDKIRKLKRKFFVHMLKISQGDNSCSDSEAFRLSRIIWGQIEPEFANHSESGGDSRMEDEQMANPEPLNENKAANDGNVDNDADADESWALRDAFEAMMSKGLSEYLRRVQLKKLMNVGPDKRKELSAEWKALCAEEAKLNVKRFRFSAKLAEASNDM
ncbi:unnamed protein product [Thlaspi arvense]|uniref:Glabrous enhancer-binding protein-like DBD domain-containing protein n=1 Tax=Thlaspi arvense TaxID=13288 RepID=A0AAU9RZ33_THLAR|nr:unnamed protein product [Thlaspi arvense]